MFAEIDLKFKTKIYLQVEESGSPKTDRFNVLPIWKIKYLKMLLNLKRNNSNIKRLRTKAYLERKRFRQFWVVMYVIYELLHS